MKYPNTTYKFNFSMSIPKMPEKLVWEKKYYNKKYIAFGDSIIAAGKQQYIISHNSSTNLRKEAGTSNVFQYDATVDEWFNLPDQYVEIRTIFEGFPRRYTIYFSDSEFYLLTETFPSKTFRINVKTIANAIHLCFKFSTSSSDEKTRFCH